jgi:hypothetical protein
MCHLRILSLLALLNVVPALAQVHFGGVTQRPSIYTITVAGDGSTDNTAAVNSALVACKDVLLDNGVIRGHVLFAKGCSQTLYLSNQLHLYVPLMLTGSLIGVQGSANGLYGQGVPIYPIGVPVCGTSPVIVASGAMNSSNITVSSSTPLQVGSYIGFASIKGGPYRIASISGTAVTLSTSLAATVPSGTHVVCESPGAISVNAGNVQIKNINVDGGQFVLNGGSQPVAQVEVYNSAFYNGAGVIPFVLDGAFEIVVRESSFSSSGSHAVQITNDNATFVGSVISFSDCLFNTGGVLINSNNVTGLPNAISFIHDTAESLSANFVDIDTTSGGFDGLLLDRLLSADTGSGGYAVADIASTRNGLSNITINDISQWLGLKLSNVNIVGLLITGAGNYGASGVNFGFPQLSYTWLPGDAVDSPGYVHGVGPPLWGTKLMVNQDPTTWTASNSGAVTIVQAPDGTRSAGLISCPSGSCWVSVYNRAQAIGVGDWIIAGLWCRSGSYTTAISQNPNWNRLYFVGATVQTPTHLVAYPNNLVVENTLATRIGEQWVPAVAAYKVTAITSAPTTYSFSVSATSSFAQAFWKPWMVRIPAGTVPDEEVVRLVRTME